MIRKITFCLCGVLLLHFPVLAESKDSPPPFKAVQLSDAMELVSFQPKGLVGFGVLLDLAEFESSDAFSFIEKKQLIDDMNTADGSSAFRRLSESENASAYLKVVKIKADLSGNSAVAGQFVTCNVISLSGKNVTTGFLFPTELKARSIKNQKTYAIAGGSVEEMDSANPSGIISKGCRLTSDFTKVIVKDKHCVLRFKDDQVGNELTSLFYNKLRESYLDQYLPEDETVDHYLEQVDDRHIRIRIPNAYSSNPYLLVSDLLDIRVYLDPTKAAAMLTNNRVR